MKRRGYAPILIAAADAAVLVLMPPRLTDVVRQLAHPDRWLTQAGPDTAIAEVAAMFLWLVAAWLGVGLAAMLLARLPGVLGRACGAASRRLLPATLRRLVAGSVGASVLLAPASAAVAAPAAAVAASAAAVAAPAAGQPDAAATPATRLPIAERVLPPPAWPVGTVGGHAPAKPRTSQHTRPPEDQPPDHLPRARAVRVRPGDSLWLIAARRLGPSAGPAQIAAAWPRWYRANRATIGDDPALIMPGQVLTPPAAGASGVTR